jgi:hypothetical protein
MASLISYLNTLSAVIAEWFYRESLESALTVRFPLNIFAGMTSGLLGMNQHNLKHAKFI